MSGFNLSSPSTVKDLQEQLQEAVQELQAAQSSLIQKEQRRVERAHSKVHQVV